MKKTYILDTNVLLYSPGAIYSFEDNNVIIPEVVLEELDNIKKMNKIIKAMVIGVIVISLILIVMQIL